MLLSGLREAFRLIFTGDARVYSAAFVSVWVAATSTALASGVGLPLGFLLAVRRFRGRGIVIAVLNAMLALPTVVVGLFVYGLVRRGAVLGPLDLLFSPAAMILGQVILAVPIVVALTQSAVSALDPGAREAAVSLGAAPGRVLLTTAWEARFGLAVMAAGAGGRLVGEVGVSMMLGGNIAGYTRSLTTAIARETGRGEFAFGIALGVILLVIAIGMNLLAQYLLKRKQSGGGVRDR